MTGARMAFLQVPMAALAWLGRQGARAIAALVFIGIAVPPVGALLKPYVTESIFVLLVIAFLRVDPAALRAHLGRPMLVVAATAWTTVAIPALFGAACLATGLEARTPELFLALMLHGVASPMMAAPALAAVMGLDATLVLITLVTSSALVPFTAPLFLALFVGPGLTLAPVALGLKLLAILAGSALAAAVIRRLAGAAAIRRHKEAIDGFNILILLVFVAAVMESVAARFLATPLLVIELAAFSFILFFAVLGLTTLLFAKAGRDRAFALGLMTTQRNLGLMLAATGGMLPDLVWLYFALAQFPIYVAPYLLMPLARRLGVRD
jgi:BASS family bile acid:Na+ symporter